MTATARYPDDGLALHTDLYQINMAQVYWADRMHDRRAVFDVYFRKLPFGNGYAVFAGLERLVRFLAEFRFTDSDLAYLQELGYADDFLTYLAGLRFTGTVKSVREGEIVFAEEPLMRIEAPLAQAQILETAILNIINYQTLVATKASRIKQVIGDDIAMEFGTRRAQEMDAAVWGTRAAFLAGFAATSNVRAAKLFGIPAAGTHAHAMVQAYGDEYTAFLRYGEKHRNCVFLVDTYDTLRSGVPNAIKAAKTLGDKINFIGIRLDSGDLAYLSKEARKMLDRAGFPHVKIYASNDLDEHTIMSLKAQGARIDCWGIGTKLITAYDQPALGAVYKLVSLEDENGVMRDSIKISSNPEKVTTPGLKRMYRIINRKTGKAEGDYVALEHETPQQEPVLHMFHPIHTHIAKIVTDFEAKELHHTIFENGRLVYELPALVEIQAFVKQNLELFWDEYKRLHNPAEYPVDLSPACWENKRKLMQAEMDKIRRQRAEGPQS